MYITILGFNSKIVCIWFVVFFAYIAFDIIPVSPKNILTFTVQFVYKCKLSKFINFGFKKFFLVQKIALIMM